MAAANGSMPHCDICGEVLSPREAKQHLETLHSPVCCERCAENAARPAKSHQVATSLVAVETSGEWPAPAASVTSSDRNDDLCRRALIARRARLANRNRHTRLMKAMQLRVETDLVTGLEAVLRRLLAFRAFRNGSKLHGMAAARSEDDDEPAGRACVHDVDDFGSESGSDSGS